MGTAIALLTLAAAALLARGLRGRRTDDHPLCRRCRFDLTGRPPTSARCPECGADLTRRRSIRVGNRQRKPLPLAAGGLLALLAGGLAGRELPPIIKDFERHKPVRWLTAEVIHGGGPRRSAAVVELHRRLDRGELAATDMPRVGDALLTIQGDETIPWDPVIGTLFERLPLPAESTLWQRFERQAVVLHFRVRPVVRQSESVDAELILLPARAGGFVSDTEPLRVVVRGPATLIGEVGRVDLTGNDAVLMTGWSWPGTSSQTAAFRVHLPVGPDGRVPLGHRTITVRFHYRVGWGDAEGPPDAESDIVLSSAVTIVPDMADAARLADRVKS